MDPSSRNQLFHIDRALVNLLQERARLLADFPMDDPGRQPRSEDLLRRTEGPFDARVLEEILEAMSRGCGGEK
ncbi:MAG: hypothetical protein QGH51_08510 [Planctomycetota bacterium]|jgi:hypothetical protein|nr:hypothetical protein [Planctomycetota bacterium]